MVRGQMTYFLKGNEPITNINIKLMIFQVPISTTN